MPEPNAVDPNFRADESPLLNLLRGLPLRAFQPKGFYRSLDQEPMAEKKSFDESSSGIHSPTPVSGLEPRNT